MQSAMVTCILYVLIFMVHNVFTINVCIQTFTTKCTNKTYIPQFVPALNNS